ncbi:MAG: indolepyruvate ferredoxin oxidoreductase subunit alpha [Alphaproteobacteria bacterium]
MVSIVNDSCIKCKTCVSVCPVSAFHEGDDMVVINPEICISCGVCISECPVGAIAPEEEAEKTWIDFNAEKSQEWPNAD